MNYIEANRVVTLSNNQKYICLANIELNDKYYILLVNAANTTKKYYAEQTIIDNELNVVFIEDDNLIEKIENKLYEETERSLKMF